MSRLLLLFLVMLGIPVALHAQVRSVVPPASYEVFAGVLDFHGFKPHTLDDAQRMASKEQAVIILGYIPPPLRFHLAQKCRQILRDGGSVLIATDHPLELGMFLPDDTVVGVTGEKCVATDPESQWANNQYCPLLMPRDLNPVRFATNPDETSLLFAGLKNIAANKPSTLSRPSGGSADWQLLADLPFGTVISGTTDRLDRTKRTCAVAASGKPGQALSGRVLILSDAGLFSNQMMVPQANGLDNDNLALADRVVSWLKGREKISQVLVLVDGQMMTQLDKVTMTELPELPPLPIPDLLNPTIQAKMTQFVNEMLGKFERNDGFNRLILKDDDANRPSRLRRVLYIVAVVAAILALLFVVSRLKKSVHQPETNLMPHEKVKLTPPKQNRVASQREELLKQGRATEYVNLFLREWFQEAIRRDRAQVDKRGGVPEILVLSGGRKDVITKQIRILWETAQSRDVLAYSRWKELQPMMQEMIGRYQAGEWRFASEVVS